ncbi:hypothetical protein [Egicoccus sp. AB-alg6-2]|uniref:hypothetical protein n=1 Tax=Egicoccus sp. AB-alg6-2 TaxID=3242692 RepID=UPI00359E71AA
MTSRRPSRLLVVLGILALLAVAVLGASLLWKSPTSLPVAPAATQDGTDAAEESPVAEEGHATPAEATTQGDAVELLLSYDPFKPVVPEPAAADEGVDPTPTPTPSEPAPTPPVTEPVPWEPDPSQPAPWIPVEPTPVPPAPEPTEPVVPLPPSPEPTEPAPDPSAPTCTLQDGIILCAGRPVTLAAVQPIGDGSAFAVIRVGPRLYGVVPGQSFADEFVLLAIDGTCTEVLHVEGAIRLCLEAEPVAPASSR